MIIMQLQPETRRNAVSESRGVAMTSFLRVAVCLSGPTGETSGFVKNKRTRSLPVKIMMRLPSQLVNEIFVCKHNTLQFDSCTSNYEAIMTKNTANISAMGANENIQI
jgi:hypothetical protein